MKAPSGQVRARARYRDDDGRGAAVLDSSCKQLVGLWLDDMDLNNKLPESTRALYERKMRQLVLPVFEHYALREITVGRVDRFLKALAAGRSYSTAKQAKTVLRQRLALLAEGDSEHLIFFSRNHTPLTRE